MGWLERLFNKSKPANYPRVTARVSRDNEWLSDYTSRFIAGLSWIQGKVPGVLYDVIDNLTYTDPYMSRFHQTMISLGNVGHELIIQAPNQARMLQALEVANELAAKCFPLSYGMDGLVNALFSQAARHGGLCCEWVPDKALTAIQRVFVVPIRSLRWQYDNNGNLELYQDQNGELVKLNPIQTTYCNLIMRDTDPYPVPPAIAAISSCMTHKEVVEKIKVWMDKVSAFGVLLASVDPPPREVGESQAQYDAKAEKYLQEIADSIRDNMSAGIGVGYKNIDFSFQNTQASAQGARDILELVLKGLFAALHTDPIFFGWSAHASQNVGPIYDEMKARIKVFRSGVKRCIEQGHRLNLALRGFGDVGLTVDFGGEMADDIFKVREAKLMESQAVVQLVQSGIITVDEARKQLGYGDPTPPAQNIIVSFSKELGRYVKKSETFTLITNSYSINKTPSIASLKQAFRSAMLGGYIWLQSWVATVVADHLPGREEFISEALSRIIDRVESDEELGLAIQSLIIDIQEVAKESKNLAAKRSAIWDDWDMAAISALAGILEADAVSRFISGTPARLKTLSDYMGELYDTLGSTGEFSIALKKRFEDIVTSMSNVAADLIANHALESAKNIGLLSGFADRGVEYVRIDGPRDNRKCKFCYGMLDRVFNVGELKSKYLSLLENAKDKTALPMATDVIDDAFSVSDSKLLDLGVALPPYHPRCRDYIVEA